MPRRLAHVPAKWIRFADRDMRQHENLRRFPVPGAAADTPPTLTANITSHPTAGIGAWTEAEIRRAIAEGIARDGRHLKPPMAYRYYAGLADRDLTDIVAYPRTVPPLP
jgi:hypothetical protein